ncbi:MAG: helix-hairpin-helix domain-containing protein [Chitinophaga sp.]|uniref:ComEA family DNA-binding protein n=1 Tax=Chitinophaga sp. TaxID=1869181 RepID=UPI001B0F9AEA|nr:helix-hairpin-helix domain-containing protein [Chitinophaga sp.]MBO9727823.1 helix-hairpin-helix domain-containing protein [Chitinophaga sp.]
MATCYSTRCGIICGILLLYVCKAAMAQQPEESLPAVMANNLEQTTAGTDAVSEDDAQWQRLNALARHRISLNTADEATLQSLGLLTPLQISHFLQYRLVLGDLLSIYELQAIPGFEPEVIRRILPYVTVGNDLAPHYTMRDYLHKGDHAVLLRYAHPLEKAKGYQHTDSTQPAYMGSPDKLFIRYRYNFPRYSSWGVVMEKDAGEGLFKGAQQQGFDFYSAHLFIRNAGKIKALALGDYTVNLGQGLLSWQGQAYGKGASVMQIKREGEVLRPYTSPGEFYFFRGAAVTLQQRHWEVTAFGSWRKQDASTDTLMEELIAESVNSSGYHRTSAEVSRRGKVQAGTAGGNVRYVTHRWQLGGNVLWQRFTPALQQKIAPYNQFDFRGQQLVGGSIDYAGSWKNVHVFGEVAASDNGKLAIVQGLLTSIAPAADAALLYRYYDKAYQSFFAKGFGDSYRTGNEQGIYMGLTLKINNKCKLDTYADFFKFPWLKYRINAPAAGQEFFLSGSYALNKKMSWQCRYNYRQGAENILLPGNPVKVPEVVTATHLRMQWDWQLRKQFNTALRLEGSRYRTTAITQQGWMMYLDAAYHFSRLPFAISGRVSRFQTSSYDARIYATESSVLYENAVSQLYGRGWQYYANVKWKVNRRLSGWGRFHQSIYQDADQIGSGNDRINGNKKTIVQLQWQYLISK